MKYFRAILSVAFAGALSTFHTSFAEEKTSPQPAAAKPAVVTRVHPAPLTSEQIAFKNKVCTPQVKKLKREFQSALAYHDVLLNFAQELEKKISNDQRILLQQNAKTLKFAEDAANICFKPPKGLPQALIDSACKETANKPIHLEEVSEFVRTAREAFAMLVETYNKGKKPELKMMQIKSDLMFGLDGAIAFIPKTTVIHKHNGSPDTPVIMAFDTQQNVLENLQAYVHGTENAFIVAKLENTICKGFVALETPQEVEVEPATPATPGPAPKL